MTKPPSHPFPAIVEEQLWSLSDYRPGEVEFIDETITEATQAIVAAVRQLIEEGMPEKKEYQDFSDADFSKVNVPAFNAEVGGYNNAIDLIHSTLLDGLEGK